MPRNKLSGRRRPSAKELEAPTSLGNVEKHPGRFPGGDSSIDLAAVNLALGSDINGERPLNLEASPGAFPDFIFAREPPPGFEIALCGGPFQRFRENFEKRESLSVTPARHPQGKRLPPLPPQPLPLQPLASSTLTSTANASQSNSTGGFTSRRQTTTTEELEPVAVIMQRQGHMSPASQGPGSSAASSAGMGAMGQAFPMTTGQQLDLNTVMQKVLELSEILKENRERTQGIVDSAELLATKAAASGASPDVKEVDAEISAGRIADLTRQNHDLKARNELLRREQRENEALLIEYERALGKITHDIRQFAHDKEADKMAQARDFNSRLQEEKDAHLATRMDRDEWHVRCMRAVEMLRNAYKLREEEEVLPVKVVAGLQNEVRGLRNALGLEAEREDHETGWSVLGDVKEGD